VNRCLGTGIDAFRRVTVAHACKDAEVNMLIYRGDQNNKNTTRRGSPNSSSPSSAAVAPAIFRSDVPGSIDEVREFCSECVSRLTDRVG